MEGACESLTRRSLSTAQHCRGKGREAQPGEGGGGHGPCGGLDEGKWSPQPPSWLDALKRALLFLCFQLCPLASSQGPAVVLS